MLQSVIEKPLEFADMKASGAGHKSSLPSVSAEFASDVSSFRYQPRQNDELMREHSVKLAREKPRCVIAVCIFRYAAREL